MERPLAYDSAAAPPPLFEVLGLAWTMLNPLLYMAIMLILGHPIRAAWIANGRLQAVGPVDEVVRRYLGS